MLALSLFLVFWDAQAAHLMVLTLPLSLGVANQGHNGILR